MDKSIIDGVVEPEHIDPLGLDLIEDDKDGTKIKGWYKRILAVFEAAVDDTSLPLKAYTQMRASYLIPIVKEIAPNLVAIPAACPEAHSEFHSAAPRVPT